MRLNKILLGLALMPLSTVSVAYCETTVTASSSNGYVDANYLRGYWGYNPEGSCYDPYEVITLRINFNPADNGLAGMTYVAASNNDAGGAVLTPEGEWVDYVGGLHPPLERFDSIPGSSTYTIFDSRGDYNPQMPWLGGASSSETATMCQLMATFGEVLAHFGAGYGAIQPDKMAMISQIESNSYVALESDHIRGAFAYSDGLLNEKYGPALTFNCSCSDIPIPYSVYATACEDPTLPGGGAPPRTRPYDPAPTYTIPEPREPYELTGVLKPPTGVLTEPTGTLTPPPGYSLPPAPPPPFTPPDPIAYTPTNPPPVSSYPGQSGGGGGGGIYTEGVTPCGLNLYCMHIDIPVGTQQRITIKPSPDDIYVFEFTTPATGSYYNRASTTRMTNADNAKLIVVSETPGDINTANKDLGCYSTGVEVSSISLALNLDDANKFMYCMLEPSTTYYINVSSKSADGTRNTCSSPSTCGFYFEAG